MSLLNRTPVRIGRAARRQRDDRVFLVATDDTHAPAQYFAELQFNRVRIIPLPTPIGSGLSSPEHVVERLKNAFAETRAKGEVQDGDQFWVLIDTDHHTGGSHISSTVQALDEARRSGFGIAVSNPCFELWLLLHHVDISPGVLKCYADVKTAIMRDVGPYDKAAIGAERFPLSKVADAIRRARNLDALPGASPGYWPVQTGTRVYRLMDEILNGP